MKKIPVTFSSICLVKEDYLESFSNIKAYIQSPLYVNAAVSNVFGGENICYPGDEFTRTINQVSACCNFYPSWVFFLGSETNPNSRTHGLSTHSVDFCYPGVINQKDAIFTPGFVLSLPCSMYPISFLNLLVLHN